MLKHRSHEIEIMDDLKISGDVVDQTLRELNTINKLLGGNQISISAFKKMALSKQHLTLADLGCGGGDMMMEMAKWTRNCGKEATFIGIDANPHIVDYAKNNTKAYPEIGIEAINIFDKAFRSVKVDIIHCCLFTHHFTEEELIHLFRQFKEQASLGVIINDLQRHPLAYWSIKMLTSVFSKSEMVRNDAAISVKRGFKKVELVNILERAGIKKYQLSWHWAFRWKLIF
jgi:2-polyprenyl-3-methyl-5-hydroxy-6-metoxy-1,4-benzoquinol methylase